MITHVNKKILIIFSDDYKDCLINNQTTLGPWQSTREADGRGNERAQKAGISRRNRPRRNARLASGPCIRRSRARSD